MVFHRAFVGTWERYIAGRYSSIAWPYWAENNALKMDLGARKLFM